MITATGEERRRSVGTAMATVDTAQIARSAATNTQQLLAGYRPALALFAERYEGWLAWRPTPLYAMLAAALALIAIFNLHKQSEFLYFQF